MPNGNFEARITEVARDSNITTISCNNHKIVYNQKEYPKFRQIIQDLLKSEIKRLNHLCGLTFEWRFEDSKPYPIRLIEAENPIYVDVHEPATIWESLLPKSKWFALEAGDYKFEGYVNGSLGTVLIERKEVSNLIGSIMNNELNFQVDKMIRSGAKAIILLKEDYLSCSSDGRLRTRNMSFKVTWDFLWNHLHTLQQENGLIIEESPNEYYTSRRIMQIYSRYQDMEHKSNRVLQPLAKSLGISGRVLSAIPGYGEDKIKQVAKSFSSLREYFNAGLKEREKVVGIGKLLSKRVDEVLDSKID